MSKVEVSKVRIHGYEALRPAPGYVLLRLYEHTESEGGIHIPESARAGCPPFGEVIADGGPGYSPRTGAKVEYFGEVGDFVAVAQAHYPFAPMRFETLHIVLADHIVGVVQLSDAQQRWVDAYKKKLAVLTEEYESQRARLKKIADEVAEAEARLVVAN